MGIITNSALKADAFHMLSDVIAIAIAVFCNKSNIKKICKYSSLPWFRIRSELLDWINYYFFDISYTQFLQELIQRLFYIDEVKNMDKEISSLLMVGYCRITN